MLTEVAQIMHRLGRIAEGKLWSRHQKRRIAFWQSALFQRGFDRRVWFVRGQEDHARIIHAKQGGALLVPGAREGGSVGLAAVRKAGPNALARFDEHASDLGIVGKKMLNQVQAKIFQGLNGVLTSQGVHGVLHGVSRENIAIVALDVRRFKVPLEAYRQCEIANVVAALLLGNSQPMNSRTVILGFS